VRRGRNVHLKPSNDRGYLYRDQTVTLNQAVIDARLEEYRRVRPDPGRDELTLLETALFLEEALGIRISDEEIVHENLGTFEAIKRFTLTRRERG
jgi:acyl carrier protein